jgi:type I restriction enzyme M protein
MAKKTVAQTAIKTLEDMMWSFETRWSVDITTAFNGLLDYIIGFFDPTGQPIEGWKFTKEQNADFHAMMYEYFQIMDRQLQTKEWFDAWGDLFMALYANGAGKEQFFTPQSLVDMMTEAIMHDLGEPTRNMNGFGKRHGISDPACGSSRNLLAGHTRYMSIYKRQPYLAGEDIDSTCCKMSAVNLAMHGCFGEIVCHNTLSEPDVVRMGYIINETMYPIPTPVPSIRRCTDPNAFVCTSAMLAARRRQDIEEKPKPEPKAEVKVEEKKQPVQLTLF